MKKSPLLFLLAAILAGCVSLKTHRREIASERDKRLADLTQMDHDFRLALADKDVEITFWKQSSDGLEYEYRYVIKAVNKFFKETGGKEVTPLSSVYPTRQIDDGSMDKDAEETAKETDKRVGPPPGGAR